MPWDSQCSTVFFSAVESVRYRTHPLPPRITELAAASNIPSPPSPFTTPTLLCVQTLMDLFNKTSHAFLDWLKRSGAEISPKIELKDLRNIQAGRGVGEFAPC